MFYSALIRVQLWFASVTEDVFYFGQVKTWHLTGLMWATTYCTLVSSVSGCNKALCASDVSKCLLQVRYWGGELSVVFFCGSYSETIHFLVLHLHIFGQVSNPQKVKFSTIYIQNLANFTSYYGRISVPVLLLHWVCWSGNRAQCKFPTFPSLWLQFWCL